VLVSFVLGPRLLALGRSRGQLPEFTMGPCLLPMGALGYPFATVGRVVTALPDDVRGLFLGCSALCNTVGFAALAIFTWRVFRPTSRWVEAAMAACITALALLSRPRRSGRGWWRARSRPSPIRERRGTCAW
jgi:hypothetical protein